MKTRKFTAMLLTLAMAFSLLTVSAGAVMDNDHDRISVDTAGPLSVVWDSETVDSEAYHTGDIVSSEDGYYPSSFYLYVDSAEENGITVTGGTLSAPVEETEGGTKYLVTNNSGGSIVIRLANAAQSNNVYTLTFAAPEGPSPESCRGICRGASMPGARCGAALIPTAARRPAAPPRF